MRPDRVERHHRVCEARPVNGDPSSSPSSSSSQPGPGPHLPVRPPRPFAVHWLVDAAVAFLAVVLVALFWGVPLVPVAIAALVVGAIAAPFTRRAEIRGLAARATTEGHDPASTDG